MFEPGLERFTDAQVYAYPAALREIRNGRKESHWMWFIFPQLRGLGRSDTAQFFGIAGAAEAREYLAHPVLSARLTEITGALLELPETNPVRIFGPVDALKLRSCMTLFAAVSEPDSVFRQVLQKYYGGTEDPLTLELLSTPFAD